MRRPGSTASILGLAFGDREVTVAEVAGDRAGAAGGASVAVTRVGVCALPGGWADSAQVLGEALKAFLKANGFGAGRCVIGLPAKWLTSRERQVPPSNEATASAMLRLQAERAFPPELKDLVYDYAGEVSGSEGRAVLLVAASRARVNVVAEGARLAGVAPAAVTASGLALASAAGRGRAVLALSPEAAELVVRSEHGPRVLRHLSVAGMQMLGSNGTPSAGVAALGSELLRTIAVAGGGGDGGVTVYDGVGLEPDAFAALSQRSGVALAPERGLGGMGVSGNAAREEGAGKYAAAVALGLAGVRPGASGVDFLHTKLAPPKQRRVGRKVVWGVIGGVVLAGLIGFPVYDLWSKQAAIDEANAYISDNQRAIDAATAMAAKLKVAEGWYANKPPVLECMKHVALAFPQEGTVWATSLALKENGKGTLAGKATDRRAIYAVRDFMMNDKRFADVTLSETHQGVNTGGGGTRGGRPVAEEQEIAFTISFTFKEGA